MADRPDRSRAWGVLAVTLALMALVAALSSTTSRAPIAPAAASAHRTADPRPDGRAATAPDHGTPRSGRSGTQSRQPGSSTPARVTGTDHHPATRGVGISTAAGAGGTGAGSGRATAGAVDGTASAGTALAGTASAGAPDTGFALSGRAAAPTAPPTTSAPGSTEETGASTDESPPSATGASSTETGAIGPGGSASFAAQGGGPVSAAATWTGATTLELGISCPDGVSSARTGVTGLSVEVDDTYGTGTCTVTLALAPGQTGTADYRVDVEPAT